jgi:hypothetical protein
MCSADVDVQVAAGVGMCLPRCENYNCNAGETCDTTVGMCVAGGPVSSGAQVTLQDLGTLAIGPEEAEYGTVRVQVAPGAVSFSVVAEGDDRQSGLALVKIVAPNGQTIFDLEDPVATGYRWSYVGNLGPAAMLFPNAPRVTLIPGTYQVTWGATLPTNTKFSVLQKQQSGVVQGGSLPMKFWFTRNQYLDARRAQTDPQFQQAVAAMTGIFAGAGITVGPLTYVDLTGAAATELAIVDDLDELAQLFATANDSQDGAVHIFLSEQVNLREGFTLLGISAGLPGPPSFPGLGHSGVAVALAFLQEDVGVFAETLAHEAGHFLGLFHLSENDGTQHDPLLDTPECSSDFDTNQDGRISGSECTSRGADNLMFWTSAAVPQRKLTNDQRFVLMRNPMVR